MLVYTWLIFYCRGVHVLRWRCSSYFEEKPYFKDHYKADKRNPLDLHMKSPSEVAAIRKRLYLSLQRVQSPPSLPVMWFCSYNEGLKCGSGTSSAPSPEPSCSDTHLKIDMQTCIHPLSTSLPVSSCPLPLSLLLSLLWSRTMFARVLSGCQCLVFCPHNVWPRPLIHCHKSQGLYFSVLHFHFDAILWCSSYILLSNILLESLYFSICIIKMNLTHSLA